MTALAPHLSAYLREHLPRERAVSPHTVKTYANCFVLLVQFAADRLKRRPTDLEIEDLGPDMIMAFLDHVETGRGSCVRTRNGRLAAIRSFFRYIEYRIPACLDQALRVRSIPTKKTDKALIDYLDRAEIKALLDAPDPRTRLGTRDRAMLHLAYAGGLRVSELVTLQLRDFPDRSLSTVHIMGKGRRERVLPLWKETQFVLRAWLAIRPDAQAAEIFLNANGQPDQGRRLHEVSRWPKKRCLALSKAERAADLAWRFSVPRSPVMLAASIAASRLLWMMAKAPA
jgi:site-specific recombinase XerD